MIGPARKLAGDTEQVVVRFDIPTRSGGIVTCEATVDHVGDVVVRVSLPPHFRDYAVAAGLDRDDADFESYLWAAAKMAFARGGR